AASRGPPAAGTLRRAAPETPAARPLERGIRGQLDDERLPSESRTERAAPEHPGRVDDVALACPVVDERGAAVVADAGRETARYRAQRIRARLRRCVGRRHDLDRMAA